MGRLNHWPIEVEESKSGLRCHLLKSSYVRYPRMRGEDISLRDWFNTPTLTLWMLSVLAATGSPPCSATLKRLLSVPAVHLFSASLQEARQGCQKDAHSEENSDRIYYFIHYLVSSFIIDQ